MNKTKESHYDVLDVLSTASHEEIKKAYQQLILKVHPDKVSSSSSLEEQNKAADDYLAINKAWKVLGNEEKRDQYDKGIRENRLLQEWPVNAEVDLDDMENNGDGSFTWPCRCSGEYLITEKDLEKGHNIVCCSMCTLSIRLLYAVMSDAEEEQTDKKDINDYKT